MRKNKNSKLTLSALQVKNIYSQNELNSELLKPLFFNRCFDKNRIKLLVSWSLKNCGQKITIDLIENLKNLGFRYATEAGISLGIDDLRIPSTKNVLLATAEKNIKKTNINSKQEYLTGIEKFQHLIDTWHKTSEILKQDVIANFQLTDIFNPVYMMAFSGARGNVSQVRQLVGMRGLMSDPQGQILDFPIKSNFREGITLTEYIISCYGARKGLVDTALKTANSGYLTRRLVDVCHHIIVCDFDCKTKRGIFINDIFENRKVIVPLQNRLIGRILAEDIYTDISSTISTEESFDTFSKFNISNSLGRKKQFKPRLEKQSSFGPKKSENLKFSSSTKKKKNFFINLGPENENFGPLNFKNVIQIKLSLFFFLIANNNSNQQIINKSEILSTSIQTNSLLNYMVFDSQYIVNQKQFYLFLNTILLYKPKFVAKRDQEISVDLAKKIARLKKSVFVRSPLTCEIKNSICQLCYGWSLAHGKLVSLGEAVGVVAAQSIGEPGTQLTMRTFHTGGVFSGDVMNEIVAPFSGKIIFDDFFPGMLIRTPHGKIAFLTKAPGSFHLVRSFTTENWTEKSKSSDLLDLNSKNIPSKLKKDVDYDDNQFSTKKNIVFQIPGLCVLFVRNQEYVTKGQSLAEFSLMAADANQRIQASHDLNAEIEGEVLFKSLLLLTLKSGKTKKIISRTTCRLGCIWILSGKICMQSIPATLFSQPGDLVDTSSIIAQSEIMSCYSGFISKHEIPTDKNTRSIGPKDPISLAEPYNFSASWSHPPYYFSSIFSNRSLKKNFKKDFIQPFTFKNKNLQKLQHDFKEQSSLKTKFFSTKQPKSDFKTKPSLLDSALHTKEKKILFSKKPLSKNWLKYPLLSYSIESFQYKKIGYFFLFSLDLLDRKKSKLAETSRLGQSFFQDKRSSPRKDKKIISLNYQSLNKNLWNSKKIKNFRFDSHKCFLSNSRNQEFKNSRYLSKNFFFKIFPQQYETDTGGQLIYDNFYLKKKTGEIFWVAEETSIFTMPTTCSKNFINYLTRTLGQSKQPKSKTSETALKKTKFFSIAPTSGQQKHKYKFSNTLKPNTKKFISENRCTNFYYNSQGKFSIFSSKLLGYTQSFVLSNIIRNKTKLEIPHYSFYAKFINLDNLASQSCQISKKNLKNTLFFDSVSIERQNQKIQHIKTITSNFTFYKPSLRPNKPKFYAPHKTNFKLRTKLNKRNFTALKNKVLQKPYLFSAQLFFLTLPMLKIKVHINKKYTPQGKLWSFRFNYNSAFDFTTFKTHNRLLITSFSQRSNQRLKKNLIFLPGQEQISYQFFPLQSKFWIQPNQVSALLKNKDKKTDFIQQTKFLKNFIKVSPNNFRNAFFFFYSTKKSFQFLRTPLANSKNMKFYNFCSIPNLKQRNSFFVPANLVHQIKLLQTNNVSHKIYKNFQNNKIYSFHYKFSQIQFNLNPLSKFSNRFFKEPYFFLSRGLGQVEQPAKKHRPKETSRLQQNFFQGKRRSLGQANLPKSRAGSLALKKTEFFSTVPTTELRPNLKTQKQPEKSFKLKTTQVVKIPSWAKNKNSFFAGSDRGQAKQPGKKQILSGKQINGFGRTLPKIKNLHESEQFSIQIRIRNKKLCVENSCSEKSLQFANAKKNKMINIKVLTKQRLTFLQPHFPWKVFIEKNETKNINFESYFFFNEKEKKVLFHLYLNSLKKNFCKNFGTIFNNTLLLNSAFDTKKIKVENKIIYNNDKINFKSIQNKLKSIKILNTKQPAVKQVKKRKVQVSKYIKIKTKPGWIYFPPSNQKIESISLNLNKNNFLCKTSNVKIRKKHEKIIKPGTICFDTILFDQYPVYCKCISINRISVINNQDLKKKNINLQNQVQFKNLAKQFQYVKPLPFGYSLAVSGLGQRRLPKPRPEENRFTQVSKKNFKNTRAIISNTYKNKLNSTKYNEVLKYSEACLLSLGFSSAQSDRYLCFEVCALKKWFFKLFSLKLRYSLLFKTYLDISQLYYTKKIYKNKFHLVIKRVLIKTLTTENLLTENLEKIYFCKNPNFTIFKFYDSHLDLFLPKHKQSSFKTTENLSFSTESRFKYEKLKPISKNLSFLQTENKIVREPSRFLAQKLRTIIKQYHFPRKHINAPVKNEVYFGNPRSEETSRFGQNETSFNNLKIQSKKNNSNEVRGSQKFFFNRAQNCLYNKTFLNFLDFSCSLKVIFIQSNKLPKFYVKHKIKISTSLIFFCNAANLLRTAEPPVFQTLANVSALDLNKSIRHQIKSCCNGDINLLNFKKIHYLLKEKNKKILPCKNLAVLISKVKSYSFNTVPQYKKQLAQQNKISKGDDISCIFSHQKIKKNSTINFALHSIFKLQSINKQNTTHLFHHYPSPDFYLKFFFKLPFHSFTFEENESNGLIKNMFYKKISILQYNIIFIIPKNYKNITTKIHFESQTKQRVFKNKNIKILRLLGLSGKKRSFFLPDGCLSRPRYFNLELKDSDVKSYIDSFSFSNLDRNTKIKKQKNKIDTFAKIQKKTYSNVLTNFNISMFIELETSNSAKELNSRKAISVKSQKIKSGTSNFSKTNFSSLLDSQKKFTKIFSDSQNYISLETPVNYTNLLSHYYGEILYSGLYLNKDNLSLKQDNKTKNEKESYKKFLSDKTEKQNYLILTSDSQISFAVNNSNRTFLEQTPFKNSDLNLQVSKYEKPLFSSNQNTTRKEKTFDLSKQTNFRKHEKPRPEETSRFGQQNKKSWYTLGDPISYGAKLSPNFVIPISGVIIQIQKSKITVRKAQPLSFSAKGLLSVYQGDIIEKNTLIMRLFYQRLKTGDIVQGIPRIEQLFEARKTNQGELLSGSLHEQLEKIFLYYIDIYNFSKAARYSLEKIQQIIVSSVQKVYRSQGVIIADKHLEIIIRQMTSKVEVIESGHTSLLPGEIVDLDWIEVINKDMTDENTKAKYVPIILGITRKSLETKSFISEASFQETTRVLTKSSIERRTDFLKGLKENVILGHLVPAGTGFYSNTALHKKMFPSRKTSYYETEIYESYNIFRKIFSPLLSTTKTFYKKKTD